MEIEDFLDRAVDAEDLQTATDNICIGLSGIEDMLEAQVKATQDLTSALYSLGGVVEMK